MSRALLATIALTLVAGSAGAFESEVASAIPSELKEAGIDQHIGDQIPLDLAFVDETGREVTLSDYFGDKPVVLAPVYYTCPMLCSLVVEGLARSMKMLKLTAETDYELVAFSFDPKDDYERAAEKRRRAIEIYERDPGDGWHFLSGSAASIDALTEAIGFRAVWDEERQEFFHAATVLILTPDGTIARYFYGVEFTPKDLRLGLVEASHGEVGSPLDQVLLYCFRYDPAAGKYTLLTMRLLRIGAVVTVIGLAAMIVTFLRLERARSKPSEGTA